MKTLLGYSLDLVREGRTTLEKVGRMVLTDAGLESEQRARALSTLTCSGCGGGLQEGWLECPYCLTPAIESCVMDGADELMDLMQELVKAGGSDLHIASGSAPLRTLQR